ncbi:MAG: Beta-ketoacyl synthase, partial [Ilumatobacteraceae bacterium]|nr:Beta-ketoacyl synthase [Ilumatobacteraceae bacterium]
MTVPATPSARSNGGDSTDQLRRALTSLQAMRGRLEQVERARREPIAIIGMGCRFPGAASPEAYWELLRDGVDAIVETPAERWDAAAMFDPDPEAPGRVATRWGGFLDHIDEFDASFFGMAPREAAQMDPQQRLLLEVAWEALEDGGQPPDRLAGTRTGVFVGIHSHSGDYYMMQAAEPRRLDLYSGTGTSHSVVSGRLSYLLDLRGPSLAIDTACSSSLVAVHLAVQSLRSGECSLALAGGVNAIIDPTFTIVASRMRTLSARGRCQPFDARGDGYARSEGCGVVLLKRLSDALADGDRIAAVIHGSAVNQDGRSNGLTAPNSLSQQAVIRDALADAGMRPDQIGMIEAHGTGTPLGDPIEVEALTAVFGANEDSAAVCTLGSAKANIGHTEGAAGVAGLIKAVLTLRHGEVPPLVHFEQLNPHITLAGTPFVITTELRPWPAGETPRRAGVSSFGWSGTNAHVVIGEIPVEPPVAEVVVDGGGPYILPISARSAGALRELVGEYATLLAERTDLALGDVCATAALRRSHHDHRLAAVGRTRAEISAHLEAFLATDESGGPPGGSAGTRARDLMAFVFSGQGSQWTGMARGLLVSDPVFREVMERCELAFAPYVDWSLVELLLASDPRIDEIDVIQPTLFAIEIALAAVWRERGVEPDAVVGHSMGEIAAAHVAGILSLDDAATIICVRSLLLRRILGRGAMAVVDLPIDEARRVIAGREDRLAIAVSNSPGSTVLSGDPDSIDAVIAQLTAEDVFCRRAKVDVAGHSPQVDPLLDELVAALADIRPQAATIPFFSTVTARWEDGPGLDADHWARNLRQPVLFAAAVQHLLDDGHGRFVELSPHPVLLNAIEDSVRHTGGSACTVASLRRDADEPVAMRRALAALYVDGFPVDWTLLHPTPYRNVALPTYPWQRQRHWIDVSATNGAGRRGRIEHPLLGWSLPLADADGVEVWENELEVRDLPNLYELGVDDVAVLPPAALVELALAAADRAGHRCLAGIRFERPVVLDPDGRTRIQVVVDPRRGVGGSITVYARHGEHWVRHATAVLASRADAAVRTDAAVRLEPAVAASARRTAVEELDARAVVRAFAE